MTARRIDTQAIHAGQAAETLALLPITKLDDEIVSA
jgi:O-acetylhomoserine/O-acetylserine sulfhydrylase-like pyridoxal-dependent enzyme